jgi:hypothetical protein
MTMMGKGKGRDVLASLARAGRGLASLPRVRRLVDEGKELFFEIAHGRLGKKGLFGVGGEKGDDRWKEPYSQRPAAPSSPPLNDALPA